MNVWLNLAPLGIIAIGLVGYFWLRRESAALDRKYGGPK
jgi:hypothetical protein